jgi:hypothetical protein
LKPCAAAAGKSGGERGRVRLVRGAAALRAACGLGRAAGDDGTGRWSAPAGVYGARAVAAAADAVAAEGEAAAEVEAAAVADWSSAHEPGPAAAAAALETAAGGEGGGGAATPAAGTPVRGSARAAARKLAVASPALAPPLGAKAEAADAAHPASSEARAPAAVAVPPAAEVAPEAAVAQRYVANPLLLAGHKFDLRVYFLVARCGPGTLQCFAYNQGYVRRSLEP